MARWRAVASSLTIIVVLGLCGACSNGSSKPYQASQPARAAQAKAAVTRARVAAAKRRLAVARRKVTAQRRAIAAAVKRRAAAHRHAIVTALRERRRAAKPATPASTPSTTVPTVTTANPVTDLAAVQRTVGKLNAEFHTGVAAGIANSEVANYWVGAGVYTSGQCAAFEAARGGGVVSEDLFVHPETFTPAPGWVDPVIGSVPVGRIYRFTIDEVQTLVPTGEQRARTFAIHATVRTDGRARLFFRCT